MGSGQRADAGEVAYPRKRTDSIEQAPVRGDARTVQLHSECEKRGVVERETKVSAQAGGSLQQGRGRRRHDERKRLQARDGAVESGGPEPGLQQQDIADFVQQQRWDVHLEGSGFHLFEQRARFFEEVFITGLEPLDEDRRVNDDLDGRGESRGSSG